MSKRKNNLLGLAALSLTVLFLSVAIPQTTFAQSCPSNTVVTGSVVNFAGQVTDLGGDASVAVWFEYGLTQNYGQSTAQQTVSQTGIYCISATGFSPCTTYHYRAAVRNSAGTGFGEDKTFTTSCATPTPTASPTPTQSPAPGQNIFITKSGRNLSDGTAFGDSVAADPSEILVFSIRVTAGNTAFQNVTVKDALPDKIVWRNTTLKLDEVPVSGDVISGVNIGNLSPNQSKTLTFEATVAGASSFNVGNTTLNNTATVLVNNAALTSDTAQVTVTKSGVAGATTVSTGLTDNIWVTSTMWAFVAALIVLFLIKSRILQFEEWHENRKNGYRKYKSGKELREAIEESRIHD